MPGHLTKSSLEIPRRAIGVLSFSLLILLLSFLLGSALFLFSSSAEAEDELEALGLMAELNRLGRDGDPIEREALLRRLAGMGGEEGSAALWALSDLYLDAFEEPKEAEARAALERIVAGGSPWALQAKCRLLALSEGAEAARLRRELAEDKALPSMLRGAMR